MIGTLLFFIRKLADRQLIGTDRDKYSQIQGD